jgi:HK97 family phage portal protein
MNIFRKAILTLASGMGLTDPRLYEAIGARETHSGERVTIDTALSLDTVVACVRLVSQTVSTLPLNVYTRDSKDQASVNKQHPLYRILHDRPNADMTASEFWAAMVACRLLWGNAYASMVKAGNRIISMSPMRPDWVTIERNADGSRTYYYANQGVRVELQEDEVLHIKGFSLDGLMGLSPIAMGRESLGAALAAEKASASFFRNGMRPSLVMQAPTWLTDQQKKRADDRMKEYTGAINAGRVPLVEGDWKLTNLSLPPEDAQLLATRGFNVETICRWFDVPPVMIGHTQSATAWGTGMESMSLWYLVYALRPILKNIEQVILFSCIPATEQATTYAEFNVDGLMRADSKGRAALYATYVDHGLFTRNEVRAMENMPPVKGGDDLTVVSNLLPIELLGEFVRGKPDNPLDPNPPHPKGLPTGAERGSDATVDTPAAAA